MPFSRHTINASTRKSEGRVELSGPLATSSGSCNTATRLLSSNLTLTETLKVFRAKVVVLSIFVGWIQAFNTFINHGDFPYRYLILVLISIGTFRDRLAAIKFAFLWLGRSGQKYARSDTLKTSSHNWNVDSCSYLQKGLAQWSR